VNTVMNLRVSAAEYLLAQRGVSLHSVRKPDAGISQLVRPRPFVKLTVVEQVCLLRFNPHNLCRRITSGRRKMET
jgi:hypothetical protein